MIDVDLEELVKKAGGRFKMVSLIQRRMRELQRGAAPLVDKQGSLIEVAAAEVDQEKIWLVTGEEAMKLREERAAKAAAAQTPKKSAKELPEPKK